MTIRRIVDINEEKTLLKNPLIVIFQFCLHGLSNGDCTIAIQPLADNHHLTTTMMLLVSIYSISYLAVNYFSSFFNSLNNISYCVNFHPIFNDI